MAIRRAVPTHLTLEDRAYLGLTARQVVCLALAAVAGYGLCLEGHASPGPARAAGFAACLAVGAAFAFVRPLGRNLEDWLFVVAHYLLTPRYALWRPRPPAAGRQDGADHDWAGAAAPPIVWAPPAARDAAVPSGAGRRRPVRSRAGVG
ncbi:MAG TPA: PrgI family protein [Thermomicrobiales bacterium]|nr:PrgI family protein [Thermomicrobiales bacterium]